MVRVVPIREVLELSLQELREYIFEYCRKRPKGHYCTMGLLLTKVKKENLFREWGHLRYSHYLVNELGIIPPTIANIWTGMVNKLQNVFGFDLEELEEVEKKAPQQLVAVSLRYAETRHELEAIWRKANYKQIGWRGLDKQKFTERQVRKAAWKNLFFNDQEAKLIDSIADFLRLRYKIPTGGIMRSKVIVVLALVYKGFIEVGEENLESWLKGELRKFNLPEEIANFSQAQSKPINKNMEKLANYLIRRRLDVYSGRL